MIHALAVAIICIVLIGVLALVVSIVGIIALSFYTAAKKILNK